MVDPLRHYGQVLKKLRKDAGFTQVGAAKRIGVSKTSVSQWECGNTLPSRDNIERLAQVYKVQGEDLHFLDYLYSKSKKELIAMVHQLAEPQ